MNISKHAAVGLLLRSAAELLAAASLVFATGWTGVRLAERVHRHPVYPGPGGNIELRLVKSDRDGDVSFEEGPGYAGWWHCRGRAWSVEWGFAPKAARHYSVEMRVSSPEHLAGERIKVSARDQKTAGDQVLQAEVPDTGGPKKWKTISLGELSLEAGRYTLTVQPGSDDPINLNLKSITLRPL